MKLKDLEIKFKTLIKDTVDRQLMDNIGEHVSIAVKARTRKGFGVKTSEGPKERLKGISESTKKRRRGLKKQGKLSSDTTPNRSNLTRSGKMLNDIEYKATRNEAKIFLKGDSKEKARKNAELGRVFMNLSKTEKREVLKIVEEEIRKGITKKGL